MLAACERNPGGLRGLGERDTLGLGERDTLGDWESGDRVYGSSSTAQRPGAWTAAVSEKSQTSATSERIYVGVVAELLEAGAAVDAADEVGVKGEV